MPEMRVHDINVVADLNAHDPTVVNPCDVVYDGSYNGIDIDDTPDVDGISAESLWAEVMLGMVPYWTLKWNWWPVLIFPIMLMRETFCVDIKIGADLLSEKYIESFNTPDVNPDEYAGSSSYIDENIDMLIMGTLCAGVTALYPLLIASEGFVRSGVGNLTPIQWGLIAASIILAFSVAFFSFYYIETNLANGNMDHGNAAYRYQILLIAILASILGLSSLLFVHNRLIQSLNNQMKEAAGMTKWQPLKSGLKSKYLTVMLVVYMALAAYWTYLYLYHLVMHITLEV